MRIVPRSEWGARYGNGARSAPLPCEGGPILHHSVTAALNGPGAVRSLEEIGQSRFGAGISYTFVVTPDGTVYEGHGIDREGAHTRGFNSSHRAICCVGNYEIDDPTDATLDAIVALVRHGTDKGWWPLGITGGHRDMAGAQTACPGSKLHARVPELRDRLTEGDDDLTDDERDKLNATHLLATATADKVAELHDLLEPLLRRKGEIPYARLKHIVQRPGDTDAIVRGILAGLKDGKVTTTQIEAAIRNVLGSLDED